MRISATGTQSFSSKGWQLAFPTYGICSLHNLSDNEGLIEVKFDYPEGVRNTLTYAPFTFACP